MRLWSIHPRYLDAKGLVALWREALLAQAVLRGRTRGYQHHPQLQRFHSHARPVSAINRYLSEVHAEAAARGYSFDASKIGPVRRIARIQVSTGQLTYEWRHLRGKLKRRAPIVYRQWRTTRSPEPHALFREVAGPLASWERTK
jgi:hypothetical protein